MGRMSDLDIVRQENGLPTDTPLSVLIALDAPSQLPSLSVDMTGEIEWGEWLEATFDPDNPPIDRLEDLEV